MNYIKLTMLFRRMPDNIVPTRQIANENYPSSIDCWGNDSFAWFNTVSF